MRQKIEHKIEEITHQPEHKRLRTVLIMTIVLGCIVILVWAFLLLPAQLQ